VRKRKGPTAADFRVNEDNPTTKEGKERGTPQCRITLKMEKKRTKE